ncbi:MAG: HrpJ domain-containing protein [Chlamydiales bacterium]|nr:HrpJ domain-containing protein [Chlamydiales bacterium]
MSESNLPRISPVNSMALKAAQEIARQELMNQVESEMDMLSWFDNAFNPVAMMRNFKTLEEQKLASSSKYEKKTEAGDEAQVLAVEAVSEIAERIQKHNYELQAKTLLIIRGRITEQDSADEILEKVLETYPDHALADEALDFLIETSRGKPQELAKEAKQKLNEQFSREIQAGRNIGTQAREFSQQGLGSATSLRDLYREILGTPREPLVLFQELSGRFSYEKLKSVILFILHSLGADLKSKGPSIPRGQLKRLIDEIQSLQGILGVFRFFQSRMQLISRQFSSYELSLPSQITFETLAKQLIKLLAEKYINAEKILQAAQLLGISEETIAQIILFTQMRDAMRQIAMRYYRTPQHFQEFSKAMLEALEKLEDQWEEEEEKKDREKK